ncbi:MAG TPA: amino acid adenylation domain-containing protein, partial [Thermodesulfovibrionales bacterium]|nr:amino acid adenylation domain-containing protein [Thermodesulfovibrionales bacterium]
VVFEDQQLTYRELNSKANQLAHYLRKCGVGPEVLVGICVERSLEMIIGILGILKAGGAYVPLDPTYPKERLKFMLEDAGCPVVLTQERLKFMLPEHIVKTVCLDRALGLIKGEGAMNPACAVRPDNLAYVIYTSGSTGRPKGVMMEHRVLCNLIAWQLKNSILEDGKTLQFASLNFDVSFQEIFSTWFSGGELVLIQEDLRRDFFELLTFMNRRKIERIFLPFVALQLLSEVAISSLESLPPLKEIVTAGEQLQATKNLTRFMERLGDCALYNQYGPSESHVVTAFALQGVPESWPALPPIGRPIANTRIYILDRYLNPVPVGVQGELHVGGVGLARGYLNRHDLTMEKFVPDPFSGEPGARLYKTGDLARYLADGNIEFLGRTDQQAKIRGFRIEPGEIEATLRGHAGVKDAVVMARENGSGGNALVVYVAPNRKSVVTADELKSFLREQLPSYMVPSAFVMVDSIPLTPSGKVDRRALSIANLSMPVQLKPFVTPRNTLEFQLTKAWERILGVQPVGITDNFFELGGHSLLAVRLASEIRKMTTNTFPVMAIFQFPSIAQLAEMLTREGWSAEFSSLTPIEPAGCRPPFFWVHGQVSDSLLPRYLDADQPLYGLLHQGLDGRIQLTTVREIAAHYLKEIRTVRPRGPYLLGGYCFGGMIALEMAQKLREEGEEVPLLFLLDPPRNCFPVTAAPHISLPKTRLPKTRLFCSRIVHHIRKLAPLQFGYKMAYVFRKLPAAFASIGGAVAHTGKQRIKMAICNVYCQLGQPLPMALRGFYLMAIYRNAIQRHTPKWYQGKIILCHSDQLSFGEGLRQMIDGGLRVHQVPGADHESILNEPYVRIWADHLNRYLSEIPVRKEKSKYCER